MLIMKDLFFLLIIKFDLLCYFFLIFNFLLNPQYLISYIFIHWFFNFFELNLIGIINVND